MDRIALGVFISFLTKLQFPMPFPDSRVHGANMGPTWVLSAPDGLHVDTMHLAIRVVFIAEQCDRLLWINQQWCCCVVMQYDVMWYWLRLLIDFTNVSRALQNNFAKIYNARNNIYAENFKLKTNLYMCPKHGFGHTYKISAGNSHKKYNISNIQILREYFGELAKH